MKKNNSIKLFKPFGRKVNRNIKIMKYGWQKTFKFRFDEIKSKCGYDNLKFSRLLLSYIVNDLKVSRNEINEALNLLDRYMKDK
jgi:hypothetical protein